MIATLNNPCTIKTEALDFTATIKNEEGSILATTLVPGFELTHGSITLDFESELVIQNETASIYKCEYVY